MHAQEDGRSCREPGRLERSERLKAVEPRHLDIEDNDVRIHLSGKVERLTAIRRGTDDVELIGQRRGDGIEKLAVVVYEKNFRLWIGWGDLPESMGHGRSIL
jgi:hypothetical protein